MNTRWTNKKTISRDLSHMQGSVPVEIDNAVGAHDKPPAVIMPEHTDELLYSQEGMGDGDFHTGPDIPLIQQVLKKVKDNEEKETNIDDAYVEANIENSMYNGAGDAKDVNNLFIHPKSKHKPKKERNVAMSSLREEVEDRSINKTVGSNKTNMILLKPADFESSSDDKLSSKKSPEMFKGKPKMPLSPKSMFKSKPKIELEGSMLKGKDMENKSECATDSNVAKRKETKNYVPSSHAGEYYQKYLEQSKAKEAQEQAEQGIWAAAERKMQEIEKKRKQEKESKCVKKETGISSPVNQDTSHNSPSSSNRDKGESSSGSQRTEKFVSVSDDMPSHAMEEQGFGQVILPQHRHLISEECVVCEVLCVKKSKETKECSEEVASL